MAQQQYNLFLVLAQAAALSSLLIGIYSWGQRHNKGAFAFAIFMGLVCCWVLSDTLELVVTSPEATLFWGRLNYLFIATVPVAWFVFIIAIYGSDQWINPITILLLLVIPIITNVFIWISPYHELIWSAFEIVRVGSYTTLVITAYGTWFWVFAVYSYVMIGYGTILLLQQVFTASSIYRSQSIWLLIGAIIPIVFNLFYVFRLIPGLQKDFTTIAFAFAGIALATGIYRYELLSLSPLARDFIIDQMQDGYIIINYKQRIIDINPAAEKIFELRGEDVLGQPATQLLPELEDTGHFFENGSSQFTTSREQNSGTKHYDVKVTKLDPQQRGGSGTIIMLRDITQRVNLLKQVQQLAITDDLTKVYNRRHFLSLAENALKLAVRYQRSLSIIMIDIDHFKEINDRYGHGAGDFILQGFVKNACSILRDSDTFARFGGEEFIALLPETTQSEALIAAERLRTRIAGRPIAADFGEIQITISLGIASTTSISPPLSVEKLVDRADRALYQAKNSGRNQVVVYEPDLPPVHPPRPDP